MFNVTGFRFGSPNPCCGRFLWGSFGGFIGVRLLVTDFGFDDQNPSCVRSVWGPFEGLLRFVYLSRISVSMTGIRLV